MPRIPEQCPCFIEENGKKRLLAEGMSLRNIMRCPFFDVKDASVAEGYSEDFGRIADKTAPLCYGLKQFRAGTRDGDKGDISTP